MKEIVKPVRISLDVFNNIIQLIDKLNFKKSFSKTFRIIFQISKEYFGLVHS